MDTEEKEMTLREMIEMVKDFVRYIWKKKFIIIPIALICGLLGFFMLNIVCLNIQLK